MSQAGSNSNTGPVDGSIKSITGNTGGALTGSNINIKTANATPVFAGSGTTETLDFGLSNLLLGSAGSITTGYQNVGYGYQACADVTGGYENTALGYQALMLEGNGHLNTAVGVGACANQQGGNQNTAVGAGAMAGGNSQGNNVAIGLSSLATANTTGGSHVAVGNYALQYESSGGSCVAIGYEASQNQVNGIENVAIGRGCSISSGGSYNSVIGANAFPTCTGIWNSVLGAAGALNYTTTESSNVILGSAGVVGDNNTIRIGNQGSSANEQNLCYIAGITGSTVTGAAVLCSASGQLGTIASSARYKDNIESIETESILALRPVSFEYKGLPGETHYGLIAEEVQEVFPELVLTNDEGLVETVKYHEMTALLLKEIQRLSKRIEALEGKHE